MKSISALCSLLIVGTACFGSDAPSLLPEEQKKGLKTLFNILAPFKTSKPWEALQEAPGFVRRNRGAAAHLESLLNSGSLKPEQKALIVRHFLELSKNKSHLRRMAQRLDRESGELYRKSLQFDVLRFFVDILSNGKESFRFSSSQFYEAYYSEAEGRSHLFHVVLPPDYSPQAKWPVVVQVHGSRSFLPDQKYPFIRARPSARGVWGFRAMSRYDVMRALDLIREAYAIDQDRIYMIGSSAGATGMMHTAAYRQDHFAGLVPLVAFGNDLPLENYRNLPIRCEHGVNDWTSSIGNVRAQFQRLKKLGYDAVLHEHPNRGHNIGKPPPTTMEWLFRQKRNPQPKHITHTCEHPRDGKAYWLTIESLSDPHRIARIEAKATDQGLTISTDNIQQFSLDARMAPIRSGQKVFIQGSSLAIAPAPSSRAWTARKQKRWVVVQKTEPSKRRAYAPGAAANLFQGEPLLVVYGTGADTKGNRFLQRAAAILARSAGPQFKPGRVLFPIRADTALKDVPMAKYNLLLVGTADNNAYIRKIASRLPFSIERKILKAGDRKPLPLEGRVLSFHFYNPDHPGRLLYIVSPYLDEAGRKRFLGNPRNFLAGSPGFKMIDQPDLLVRGADLRLHREMQLNSQWHFIKAQGENSPVPKELADRTHLAIAHMKVMRKVAKADFALWWGPEDKGAFGGYDFNWLPTLAPESYTRADYAIRKRETECLTSMLSGTELLDIDRRWIANKEIITWPEVKKRDIKVNGSYRIVIPLDLVVKLGNRRKTLSRVSTGPLITPDQVAREIFVATKGSPTDSSRK